MRPAALRTFYIASFVAFGVYLPYFPPWLEARGIHGAAMGLIAATFPATGLVAPVALGVAADALRLRSALLRFASALGVAAFGAIAALAAVEGPLGIATLVPAVALFSIARSGMSTLADVLTLEHAAEAGTSYGRIRLFGSAGFLLGAIAGGRMLHPTQPLALPCALLAAVTVAFAIAMALPAKVALPPPPSPGQARALLAALDVRLFFATAFLWQASHSSYDLCYSLHLRDRGLSGTATGAAWALGVLAEIALMGLVKPASRALAAPAVLPVALALSAIRWLLLSAATSAIALFALQPLHAITFGAIWLAGVAFVRERAPAGGLATAQGLFAASSAAGAVVGMLTWGSVYRERGGAVTFGAAAGVAMLGAVVAAAFASVRKRESARTFFAHGPEPR